MKMLFSQLGLYISLNQPLMLRNQKKEASLRNQKKTPPGYFYHVNRGKQPRVYGVTQPLGRGGGV